MNKYLFYIFLVLTIITSCKTENKKTVNKSGYLLNVTIENLDGKYAYIQKLNNPVEKDSALINTSNAKFTGNIDVPERYILTIENTFGGKMFVLENDSIHVDVKNDDLLNATITNSKLNDELILVQKTSEKIYDKIDLLFPDLQRARLENNADFITEIAKKMSVIEDENIAFNFKYANEHPSSFISAMILHDLSKRDSIDIKKIADSYQLLSDDVKKSSDAQYVHNFIQQLH